MWGALRLQVAIFPALYFVFLTSCEQVEWCYPSDSSDAHRNGGFGGGDVPHALEEQCHINVVDATEDTLVDFLEKCKNTPCLIRNAVDTSWRGAWSLDNLTKSYGEIEARIQVKTRKYETASSSEEYQPVKELLGRFVEAEIIGENPGLDMVWDWIDKGLLHVASQKTWRLGKGKEWEDYQKSIGLHPLRDRVIPDLIAKFYENTSVIPIADSFVAGGACSGTFIHNHGAAFAILPHGMKRWAFLHEEVQVSGAYEEDSTSDERHQLFFNDHVPADLGEAPTIFAHTTGIAHPVLLCTQNAGDAIFVPDGWQHATLNIWPSLAAIMEMPSSQSGAASTIDREVLELYRKFQGFYVLPEADLVADHDHQKDICDDASGECFDVGQHDIQLDDNDMQPDEYVAVRS